MPQETHNMVDRRAKEEKYRLGECAVVRYLLSNALLVKNGDYCFNETQKAATDCFFSMTTFFCHTSTQCNKIVASKQLRALVLISTIADILVYQTQTKAMDGLDAIFAGLPNRRALPRLDYATPSLWINGVETL